MHFTFTLALLLNSHGKTTCNQTGDATVLVYHTCTPHHDVAQLRSKAYPSFYFQILDCVPACFLLQPCPQYGREQLHGPPNARSSKYGCVHGT
jgi:hypothetical protein